MLANEHSNTMNKIETQCMAIRSMFDSCAHSSYYTMQWRQVKDLSLNQRTNERTNEIYFTHDMIWRFCSFLLHFHSFLRCVCNGTDFGVQLPFDSSIIYDRMAAYILKARLVDVIARVWGFHAFKLTEILEKKDSIHSTTKVIKHLSCSFHWKTSLFYHYFGLLCILRFVLIFKAKHINHPLQPPP